MRHFVYKHLPGYGLGESDPYRPRVTGGIGYGIYVVSVTDVVTGEVTLKWFYGNPFTGWAVELGSSLWSIDNADTIWQTYDPTIEPWLDPEQVWTVIVGSTLWSIWNPENKWLLSELDSKWDTDLEMKWSYALGTSWEFGKVLV